MMHGGDDDVCCFSYRLGGKCSNHGGVQMCSYEGCNKVRKEGREGRTEEGYKKRPAWTDLLYLVCGG